MFFSAQYLPTVGGIERYTNSLATELVKNGHSAVVITSAIESLPREETDKNGIKIYRLPVKWAMDNRFPILIFNNTHKNLLQKIKSEKADFAVMQTKFYTNSVFASSFCKKNKIPAIVVEHGTAHLIQGGVLGVLGNIYEHIAAKYIYRNCKNFYGVSSACCDWLLHFGIKTNNVLYNAVNPDKLLEISQIEEDKLYQKVDFKNKTTIAFSGRFIKEKGVMELVQAFELLQNKFSNLQLVMAGDGPLFEQVKKMNTKNVILLGNVSYSQSLAVLKNSDIFCLPTFSEGFSTSVLEAAALKTAIITTKTGGSPEIIISKDHGYLLKSMQIQDIYDALFFAMQNPDFKTNAAENAYKILCEKFTWDKVQKHLVSQANQIIKG